jgi:hypothetical protein
MLTCSSSILPIPVTLTRRHVPRPPLPPPGEIRWLIRPRTARRKPVHRHIGGRRGGSRSAARACAEAWPRGVLVFLDPRRGDPTQLEWWVGSCFMIFGWGGDPALLVSGRSSGAGKSARQVLGLADTPRTVLICTIPLLASFFDERSATHANLASYLSTAFCFSNLLFLGLAQRDVGKVSLNRRCATALCY